MRAEVRAPHECGTTAGEEPSSSCAGAARHSNEKRSIRTYKRSPTETIAKQVKPNNDFHRYDRQNSWAAVVSSNSSSSHRVHSKDAENMESSRISTRNSSPDAEDSTSIETPEDPRPSEILSDAEAESDDERPQPSTSCGPLFGYDPDHVVPWASKCHYPLSLKGLHEEILDAYRWLRPSPLETSIRFLVYARVRDILIEYWAPHNIRVSVFGSLRTGLFLPSSDIDILVECADWVDEEQIKIVMEQTSEALQHVSVKVAFYPTAFVPIIKLIDKDTNLHVDISFNTVQGVKAAQFMEKEFPVMEPLLLLLKQYVFQYKLNEAYNGGLSSYGLMIMLVNFLQIHHAEVRGVAAEWEGGPGLGFLLLHFFEVYGHELNYATVSIDIASANYTLRDDSPMETRVGGGMAGNGESPPLLPSTGARVLLSVQDPLHEGNEVCRAAYNIYSVRTMFQSALAQLRAVFVSDRPASRIWRTKVYKGSILARILRYSPKQIYHRNWLKGLVMGSETRESNPGLNTKTFIANSILAPSSDLACLQLIPKSGLRALEIKRPEEATKKSMPQPPSRPQSSSSPSISVSHSRTSSKDSLPSQPNGTSGHEKNIASKETAFELGKDSSMAESVESFDVPPKESGRVRASSSLTSSSLTSSTENMKGAGRGLRRTGDRGSGRGGLYQPPAARRQAEKKAAAAAKAANSES